MVIVMVVGDGRAGIAALADAETLYVFGVIAARTSKLGLQESDRVRSTPYVTPFGLMRETSLSRDVVEESAGRLKNGETRRAPNISANGGVSVRVVIVDPVLEFPS